MLSTNQLKETIDFYTNKLGFILKSGNEFEWAFVGKDNVEIMFTKPNEHILFDKPICTGSFYINVDNVDQVWDELKNNVKVVYDMEDFDYGMREFAIYDNNGYIVQFGQDIGNIKK